MGAIDLFGEGLGREGTNSNLGNGSESEAFRAHPFLLGSEWVGVGGSSSELGQISQGQEKPLRLRKSKGRETKDLEIYAHPHCPSAPSTLHPPGGGAWKA